MPTGAYGGVVAFSVPEKDYKYKTMFKAERFAGFSQRNAVSQPSLVDRVGRLSLPATGTTSTVSIGLSIESSCLDV